MHPVERLGQKLDSITQMVSTAVFVAGRMLTNETNPSPSPCNRRRDFGRDLLTCKGHTPSEALRMRYRASSERI